MRSVSRSISLGLVFWLAALLVPALVPSVAQATSSGNVTCSWVNGVYTCTDGGGGIPDGVSCAYVDGIYTCHDQGGLNGTTCSYVEGVFTCTAGGGAANGPSGSGGDEGNVPNGSGAQTGGGWLDKLTGWFGNAIHAVVQALFGMLHDLVLWVFKALLGLFATMVSAIKPPDFISQYSMGTLLGNAGPIVGFFISQLRVGEALLLIGAGYAFRLLRKVLTLFQW